MSMAALGLLSFCLMLAAQAGVPIIVTSGPSLTMNPNENTPLAGVVELAASVPVRVTLEIGEGAERRIVEFPDYAIEHRVPVLGLRPSSVYPVRVTLTDQGGTSLVAAPALEATTGPLPADFPEIDVVVSKPESVEPGYTLLDQIHRGRNLVPGELYTIILDKRGDVVWYSTLGWSLMLRLSNGNLTYRAGSDVTVIDMLGNLISKIRLSLGGLNHEYVPTPRDTILALGTAYATVDAYPTSDTDCSAPKAPGQLADNPVVEFDAEGKLVHLWRLSNLLQTSRIGYGSLNAPTNVAFDWVHANAVIEDPVDDSLIVSSRHQDAVFKFSKAGVVKWILAPHNNWSEHFKPLLLSPIGSPFEWSYHQHAPMLTGEGTLLVHDNGNYRASPCDPKVPDPQSVSRAVEYRIDEVNMTVQQVWEYGTDANDQVFNYSRGDANWLPFTGNALITYSDVRYVNGVQSSALGLGLSHTRLVEVTREDPPEEVFYALIYDPNDKADIGIYRSNRIPSLYPDNVTVMDAADMATQGTTAVADAQWASVNAWSEYADPVVIVGPPSYRGGHPGVVRLRNVTGSGFDLRFQEWDYRERDFADTIHRAEIIPFIILEPGRHTMNDGSVWEAGTFDLAGTGVWRRIHSLSRSKAARTCFSPCRPPTGSRP